MARLFNSPILGQLRSARTVTDRIAALRALKNEVVGHSQLKEAWIGLGVLEPIARTIALSSTTQTSHGKAKRSSFDARALSDDDTAKLQALQLLASFANGGPAFLSPIHAADIIPALLTNLSPDTNPPDISLAALRALIDIIDASNLADPSSELCPQALADTVFTTEHIQSLASLLILPTSRPRWHIQVTLAARVVARLCTEERHRHALVMDGVLDALATRMASFAVASGYVVPGAEAIARRDGLLEAFPSPAPRDLRIQPVLEAIAAVLGDSKYRAHRLTYSPSLIAVFPSSPNTKALRSSQDEQQEAEPVDRQPPTSDPSSAMDYLLPMLSISSRSPKPSTAKLPHATSYTAAERFDTKPAPYLTANEDSSEDQESPLIPWLICLVRDLDESERLSAASILAALFQAGLATKNGREHSIGLLVVPVLVGLMSRYNASSPGKADDQKRWSILEKAPRVLACLMTDRDQLQSAAFDCGAIGVLTRLLKHAYEPVEALNDGNMWSPHNDTPMDVETQSSVTQLGDQGQEQLLVHRIRLREAALMATAALGTTDKYRDALIKEDFIPYVVESLSEFPKKPQSSKEKPKDRANVAIVQADTVTKAYGRNPSSVIIAACHVTRMLSRSVSILRTAIVDYKVADPILRFMKHPDLQVQTAATAVMCNMVLECSPVRELLTEHGVLDVLCEHAHSDSPALRLNALWALKHFVDAVGPDLKKRCLEELGSKWLLQLIWDSDRDSLQGSWGEAPETDSVVGVDHQPHKWFYVLDGVLRELDASGSSKLRQAEDKLAVARDAEFDPARQARNNEFTTQEQGLDLIRNLIGRPGSGSSNADSPSETTEMIDHILNTLGTSTLFDVLSSKLQIRTLGRFSQRANGQEAIVVRPHPRLIEPVIYILVHMAASVPRHRQLVVDQAELLKALCQQAASKDAGVRTALCHLVINLTSQEDEEEAPACQQRAQILKTVGFLQKMNAMRRQDRDINVRERASTAAWQLEQAAY